jgi:peptide/nickel transport system substrate-binding protein
MNPSGQNDNPSAQVNNQMYNRLITLDYDTFEPLPSLAHSWDIVDARTVTFFLRDDVTFHNGQPLTAADVKWSLDATVASPPFEPIFGMIDNVEIVDDHTVTVTTEMDFAPIMRHIAHSGGMIVPYGMSDEELREHPIGTGPFMFDSIIPGERLELVRNPNYWGEEPLLETITIIQITDPSARVLALQAGDVDLILDVQPPDMSVIEGTAGLVLNRRVSLSTDYIGFNNDKAPFDDVRVRQAINYAFNLEAAVDAIWMGQGAVQHGPVPAQAFGATDVDPFDFNLDRARELMAEAGWEDGFEASFWFNTGNAAREAAGTALAHDLAAIGITLTIEGVEWADYLDRTAAGEHDMFILGWVTVTGDADYGLFPLFHTDNLGAGGNRTFFSDPRLDALLEEGRSETDPNRRMEIYAEAQNLIRDEAAWVFLRSGENVIGHVDNLRGFRNHPAAHHSFFNIWFE